MTEFAEIVSSYVGRRTVLVAGTDFGIAAAVGLQLISAGVEVHVIDAASRRWTGVASANSCDLSSDTAIDAAMRRIGPIVQHVFHCATDDDEWRSFLAVAAAARPLMLIGGSIVGVGLADVVVDEFVREHARAFADDGVRLVTVTIEHSPQRSAGVLAQEVLEAGAPGLA